jgi:hypothetical protein
VNHESVVSRDKIQIDLIKLADNARLLRFTDPHFGLSLEKRLATSESIARQKESLFTIFEAALARAELQAA